MELLFSQQADYLRPTFVPRVDFDKIKLNFVEAPLFLEYFFREADEGYFRGSISMGWAYARLLKFEAITSDGINLTNEITFFNKNTQFFHLATTGFFNRHFGINARWALSTDWGMDPCFARDLSFLSLRLNRSLVR